MEMTYKDKIILSKLTPQMEPCFDFLAGWIGGCAGLIVGHPFDTIKVRLQTKNYKNSLQCVVDTYKHQRIRGFYNGMALPLLINGVSNCVFFGVYGNSLRFLGHSNLGEQGFHPPLRDVFFAGCVGGIAQAWILTPAELVKIQLQCKNYKTDFRGLISYLKSIYTSFGLRGCFKGFSVQMIRDCPSSGLYMLVYEFGLKNFHTADSLPTNGQIMLAGGLAGVLSWLSIVPLDVVKSRIQADDHSNPRYRGMIHCFVDSYRRESITIFSRGSAALALRAFPTNAVTLVIYSTLLDFCHRNKF